jgi:hypothetical protein
MESGEAMFERLCAALDLTSSRVAAASILGKRRPDFLVEGMDGTVFYAEVKTISPNTDEADMILRNRRGEVVSAGGTPGERVRSLIGKANGQLKAMEDGRPGVLVVFNPEIFLRWHTDPYFILTAMRGLDVVDVRVPLDPRHPPQFGELRSGPKKRMTPDANTSTAAVICPIEVGIDEWRVDAFHNHHATIPLPPAALLHECVHHWWMSDDERAWRQLT